MGGGTNRFSSLVSSLPHPGPPSSRRPPGRASRSGAGQPKNAPHPPPCSAAARTQEQRPYLNPLPSTCWFCRRRPSQVDGFPPSVPSRVPVPGSCACFYLVSPHFTRWKSPRVQRPPSTWPRDRRSPPLSLLVTAPQFLISITFTQERDQATKTAETHYITLIISQRSGIVFAKVGGEARFPRRFGEAAARSSRPCSTLPAPGCTACGLALSEVPPGAPGLQLPRDPRHGDMAGGHRLLLENARQVVLVCARGERFLARDALRSLAVLEDASLVVGRDGFIKAIGPADVIQKQFSEETFEERIDCSGKCILPGLVDAHTHPVWAGERVHEFAMKLAGATYMDIHQAGGGINFTVERTRQASEEELFSSLQQRLQCMMRAGTTLVECKSGYGLDLETELKMLRVIERARQQMDLGISATYCGAHSVPKGKTATEAADDIINNHLPKLKELSRNGQIHVDNIDVFCEKGVFDLDSTRRILQGGKDIGLQINFHGDELHPMKAAELGAELGARAVSHLEEVSDEGVAAMAAARCSAVLLPTTAYMLRLKQPRARKMLDEGVIVALGSDFNPNAYCFSMPVVMHLACVNMRMSMPEALAAATINAAYVLGKSHSHGSLEVGKQGDLIIINSSRWEHLIYQLGGHNELIEYVIAKGKVIYKK